MFEFHIHSQFLTYTTILMLDSISTDISMISSEAEWNCLILIYTQIYTQSHITLLTRKQSVYRITELFNKYVIGYIQLKIISKQLLPRDASAERGYEIAFVCLSVTIRYHDHTGWNSSKIISRPNSLRPLLWLTPTWAIWCNGNTPKIRVE